jgi:glycosyltransferase involved in cell wall biosynthesis
MFIVSNELKQSAINSDCIHPKKLQVVNNGVDVDKFKRVSSSRLQKLRLAFGISHDERLITIVARLHPLKNHKLLLQAMRELINYEPKARLLIVGEGELRTELEYIARELGLDSKISFLGDRRDIPDILNLTEVFVLCSVKEGLPLVLLESMAAEVPIVVTSGANKSKIIEHGKTGLQVRPTAKDLAKSIFLLLQDKQLSQCLAENAKKNIEQSFSVKNTVRTYQDFYLNCNSPDYNKI